MLDHIHPTLFLGAAARGSDFAGLQEIADVLLQKLVVVIKSLVFVANGIDAADDCQE